MSGGSSKNNFEGDLLLWVRLLLPGVVKRVYNMQSRQLVKVFARIFSMDEEEMVDDLSEGDVAETIGKFYEQSKTRKASLVFTKLTLFSTNWPA